jgi:hypothetical protein
VTHRHGAIQKKSFRVECRGQFQGRFVTSVEGLTMPVFTFEKISPPMRRAPASAPVVEKPRSAIVQILDRFVETRAKRKISADKAGKPHQRKSSK